KHYRNTTYNSWDLRGRLQQLLNGAALNRHVLLIYVSPGGKDPTTAFIIVYASHRYTSRPIRLRPKVMNFFEWNQATGARALSNVSDTNEQNSVECRV